MYQRLQIHLFKKLKSIYKFSQFGDKTKFLFLFPFFLFISKFFFLMNVKNINELPQNNEIEDTFV